MIYFEALKALNGRDRKKIGNHTYLEREEGSVALRYHATIVLRWYDDGDVTYHAIQRWHTSTTKDRMNYGPYHITQKNFDWYITTPSGQFKMIADSFTVKADGSTHQWA